MRRMAVLAALAAVLVLAGCARTPEYGRTAADVLDVPPADAVIPCEAEEVRLLSRAICAAAGDAPYLCQAAVGAVAVNRCRVHGERLGAAAASLCPGEGEVPEERTPASDRAAAEAVRGLDPTGGATAWAREAAAAGDARITLAAEGYVFWQAEGAQGARAGK